MKATEQYFPVVLFIMLHKVVLTFKSVGEIVKCNQSISSSCCSLFTRVLPYLTLQVYSGGVDNCVKLRNARSICNPYDDDDEGSSEK